MYLMEPQTVEDLQVKFAVSLSCFIYFFSMTVITYFQKDNPINKMTMIPYYVISL